MKTELISDSELTKQECYFIVSGYLIGLKKEKLSDNVLIKFKGFLNNL